MATKKFIIEVEEGDTDCGKCPYALKDVNGLLVNCIGTKHSRCNRYNLATMKIKAMEEEK